MHYKSTLVSSILGNMLEWYDFGLFAIFAPIFCKIFFPHSSQHIALLGTFSIFAIGFFCRPLGALFFGYLGDRYGRMHSLRVSVLMIALPTFFISIIPSYATVGKLAPILLVATRMWQGFSIGGEYGGNLIYLAENAPRKQRGLMTAFACMGANAGILAASLMGIVLTKFMSAEDLNNWGWRLAYFSSGILCILIYRQRLKIKAKPINLPFSIKNKSLHNPLKHLFSINRRHLLRTIGMVSMGTTFYYFCFTYLPIYFAQHTKFSSHFIAYFMALFMLLMIFLIPLAGWLSDRLGRRRMLLISASMITLLIVPGFYVMQADNTTWIMSALTSFTFLSSLEQGSTAISAIENFPQHVRFTGISFGYNIGNGLIGGTLPLVCEWLQQQTHYMVAPAMYVATFAMLSGLVIYFFVPETHQQPLC